MKPLVVSLARAYRDDLIAAAREAMRRAYAPYSRYRVGAAVLADDARIFAGANVENASYGLTICAERAAVAVAVAAGARRLLAAAIVSDRAPAPTPCGACRQVLAEFAPPEAPIFIVAPYGSVIRRRLGELLPYGFAFAPPKESRKR